MMGEQIAVMRRTVTGADGMGEPEYEWTSETVDNCLVKPSTGTDAAGSGTDIAEDGRPDALKVTVSVALPKGYTEGKPIGYFEHARIALISRGMDAADPESALYVHGCPMRTVPCPTAWDTVLKCGRTDG